MVKIFGKIFSKYIFFSILIFNSFCFSAKLELNILSLEGQKLDKAGAGVPFVVEVVTEDVSGSQEPKIEGIDDFYIGQRSFQMRMINGASSTKISYQVRIDGAGKYKIGPARLNVDGKDIESNIVDLEVSTDQIESPGQKIFSKKRFRQADNYDGSADLDEKDNLSNNKEFFFKLFADKESVVVGEKINCVLRFYYLDGADLTVDGVDSPAIKDAKKIDPKNGGRAISGQQKVDGSLYNYYQWAFSVIPKKVGQMTIPATRLVMRVPVEQDDIFSNFASFFGHTNEQRVVFSNSLNIDVKNLPKYDGIVDAVGEFLHFSSSVDRAVAKAGDGVVYTLELEGSGDLDSVEIKELQDFPAGAKYYDSKRYVLDNSAKEGMRKKRFEFIVQGLNEGAFEIPGQTFTFFDVKSKKYKTLKSAPVGLKILPSLAKEKVPYSVASPGSKFSDNISAAKDNIAVGQPGFEIKSIGFGENWRGKKDREMNFLFFIMILFLPVILCLLIFFKKIKNKVSIFLEKKSAKKGVYKRAIKNINALKKNNDYRQVYQIFIIFFSQFFDIEKSNITSDYIKQKLVESGVSEQQVLLWEDFFEKLMALGFYDNKIELADCKNIFVEAISWINIFEDAFKKPRL